jgi:hypothetical protein
VRRLALALGLVLCAASPALAERSDPAFLGVSMIDQSPGGPCEVTEVTPGSGAEAGGVRARDVFVSLDGAAVGNCNELFEMIQRREPNARVRLQLQRDDGIAAVEAQLMSRAEVMRQRFVGRLVPLATVIHVEDGAVRALVARGKTTIIGWFDPDCTQCNEAFAQVARWVHDHGSRAAPIAAFAATAGSQAGPQSVADKLDRLRREQRRFDVPLVLADTETFGNFAIADAKRISFMVVDCHGVVQYAVPLKPDADDGAAVLEELFVATEQAARRK